MADRRQQDQRARKGWSFERHGEPEGAGEGMNDDDGLRDAPARQSGANEGGLPSRRRQAAARPARTPAVARTIDREGSKTKRRQGRSERGHHVGVIA
jgi:hypothetical protein